MGNGAALELACSLLTILGCCVLAGKSGLAPGALCFSGTQAGWHPDSESPSLEIDGSQEIIC